MNNRFFNPDLAGGAMLDIGVYALSFIAGSWIQNQISCCTQVKSAPTGVDEQAGLLLMNKEGQMATVIVITSFKTAKARHDLLRKGIH